MLDLEYRCVRHDLAGNGKFVFWQFCDEHFASRDDVRSCENKLERMAGASEGYARPCFLRMGEYYPVAAMQFGQSLADTISSRPTGPGGFG
tara:strand:- start:271 stop:543 length:273 start_codon:yes stop_codon:yes gene_type:complete